MARLILPNGTETRVLPDNGKKWTLEELQRHVGGYIQLMPGMKSLRMYFDEDGAPKGLPFNAKATELVLDELRGAPLRYVPQIVGNAIVLEPGEK